jgi:hypothetical protein
MNRKSVKSGQRRATQQTSSHSKANNSQRSHIFLNDPHVQEIKRALSPFWAWRVER